MIESVVAKIGPQDETTKLTAEINVELNKVLPDHAKVASLGNLPLVMFGLSLVTKPDKARDTRIPIASPRPRIQVILDAMQTYFKLSLQTISVDVNYVCGSNEKNNIPHISVKHSQAKTPTTI